MREKRLKIAGQYYALVGDTDYLGRMGEEFEPHTSSLLAVLCNQDSQVFDIGANIGLTALAAAQACCRGQVVAFEPVPKTFDYLQRNISTSGLPNITALNTAVGARSGSVSMFVDERNLATSFVVDISADTEHVMPLTCIDQLVEEQSLPAPDFIKIDVEGCELEVLKGARRTIQRYQPRVMLEMNHWCLNVFRSVSLPEFRTMLLDTFPVVYAVDEWGYLDFADPMCSGRIFHDHVFANRYMNIVAGFDRADLIARFQRLPPCENQQMSSEPSSEARLQAVLNSTSWKITAPLRRLAGWWRRGQ